MCEGRKNPAPPGIREEWERSHEEEETGRISVKAEYRGTPEEIRAARRILRRTMYRLRAAGVDVFGTVILHERSEIRSVVFRTEKK